MKEAKIRRKKFISSLQLLAYDGQESEQYQRFIWDTLDDRLGKCDVCIREYYLGKVEFMETLREDFEEEDISNFFAIINRRDVQRVIRGLTAAEKALEAVPEHKRGTSVLEPQHLHALFEALICEAFLRDEELLRTYFDKPFKMIQTKKPLKMRDILPAAVRFLFHSSTLRMKWATELWSRIDRCPTDVEWDWAIKDCLQKRLQQASEPNEIAKMWSALTLIVSKLDERMITHKLFDLHPNIGTTALNHLAKGTAAIPFILSTLNKILLTAPDAFWQVMGSISSQTIVEQVFASSQFDKFLQESTSAGGLSSLDVLSWILPLLQSLKPANRPPAAQTIVNQLFERIDNDKLTHNARRACFKMAVKAILKTVMSFAEDASNPHPVERLVFLDTLNLVGHRLDEILKARESLFAQSIDEETGNDIASLVKNSVALECRCLKEDFQTLSKNEPLRHGTSSYTPELWNSIIHNLRDDYPELSSMALIGTMPLPGLEKFRFKDGDSLAKEKTSFNSFFDKVTGMFGRLLERLAEFRPDHLDYLFRAQDTSMYIIAALFSPDPETSQAAIEVVKTISGESGRKEALAHLINAFLGTSIFGVCWVFRRVANMKTFASVPRMLKTGMDILDVLCNPTNGQLRRADVSVRETKAIQSYWSYQWIALKVIFGQTERWSQELRNKELMIEVCRDAMQYAEALFDQYDLIASVWMKSRPDKAAEIPKLLLDSSATQSGSPLNTLDTMCKWLRLRDEYLADTLVSLISNMLNRLKQHQALVTNNEGLAYVEEVATKHSVRTILSASQKATLIRALENYYGRQISKPTAKKQSTLNLKDWTDSAAIPGSGTSSPDSRVRSPDEFGDDDIADEDLIEIASKTLDTHKASVTSKDKNKIKTLLSQPQPSKLKAAQLSTIDLAAKKAQEARAFIENRKREEAARKLRDKEAALKLRGKSGVGAHTAGQGSGLAGIGVLGKDHSSGPNSLMVSSESESETDSDEELFGKPTNVGLPLRNEAGPRKPVPAGPVRKIKKVRSQKDVRARLAPDLSDLHRTILGWDFFADTDLPPNSVKDDYTLVTETFKTTLDYQKTFEPLLILEGWQSFRSAREEGNFKPFEVKVANSLIVDSFFEINSQMSLSEGRDLNFGASDVVLLSKSKRPDQDPNEPHCLARVKEITRKRGEMQVVYRVNAGQNSLRPFLNDKATVYGVQVLSLTPLEREYGALMALQYYDLCEEIIRAKPSPLLEYTDAELQPIKKTYNVNIAQAKAVKSALDNDAFTLIQGPPGSGKTKTICALVGAMLTGFVRKQNDGPRLNTASGRAPAPPPAAKKILVCAPSNAAVDELVMRLKLGVTMLNGSSENISVVRLGKSDRINANVKDVTLEELVNAKLSVAAPRDAKEDIQSVMMEHKAASEEMITVRDRINEQRGKGLSTPVADEQLMDSLRRKKNVLGAKIDTMRERQNAASRDVELSRKRIQQEILDSAHVLCATLSGSGHEIFQSLNVEFETVIIDEAAQSIELSALIPLKYGCSKCILVGDPKQLPPTVLSRQAAKFQYEQSLFARMEHNHKKDVHLLDTQYRMHPEISLFPSKTFYDSRLKDGEGMAALRRRPWHHSEIFAPYRFFDVQGMSQAATKGHSLVNVAELNVAMQLYDRLISDVPKYDFSGKIGIITPYKGQLRELQLRFKQRYGEDITSVVEFNTTDAFQGRESEIIIFSCVRASTQGIGFLNDIRRMNVGLTRAKCSLWVLGNSQSLMQGEFWRALVTDAKARNVYTDGDLTKLLRRPLLTEDMMKDDVEMMDVNESTSETVTSSTVRADSSVVKAEEKRTSLDSRKGSLGQSRNRVASDQSSPAPSRPSSNISRQSSTSSVTKTEVKRQDSGQSGMKREVPRIDSGNEVRLLPGKARAEGKPGVDTARNGDVYEPSGGRYGLNELANCSICGSYEHYSSNCDNDEAKAASFGNCRRCHQAGHSYTSCPAPRCMSCGEVGHSIDRCHTPLDRRLNKTQQAEVRKEEVRFEGAKDRAREKRAEKQLGEHGAKIPTIKSTAPTASATSNGTANEAKRKRDESSDRDRGKVPRVNQDGNIPGIGLANNASPAAHGNGRSLLGGGGLPRPPGRPTGVNNGQPVIRKKKTNADDMFMRRK